jgi:pimeloyl-ACP methyl ester carboxylesterase
LSSIPAPTGTVRLPDGRALAYDDIGDTDAPAVIYLHGCPDCRLSRPPNPRVDGVRLLAVDRPGYGRSDVDPVGDERTQADDVVALADALAIERFAVLGWSAGGPGALALGALHPSRITAIGVAAGQVPMIADRDVWDAIDPVITMRGDTMKTMAPDEFASMVAPLLAPLDAPFELMMEAITEGKDAAYLDDLASVDGLHEQLALGAIAAVERGLAGAERDMRAMVSPWPFELAAVAAPVVLWYAADDHRFKPPAGQWLADRLPDARLEVFEGTSHLLPLVHWARLMNDLLALAEGEIHAPQP